jgi:hypothetical protein
LNPFGKRFARRELEFEDNMRRGFVNGVAFNDIVEAGKGLEKLGFTFGRITRGGIGGRQFEKLEGNVVRRGKVACPENSAICALPDFARDIKTGKRFPQQLPHPSCEWMAVARKVRKFVTETTFLKGEICQVLEFWRDQPNTGSCPIHEKPSIIS